MTSPKSSHKDHDNSPQDVVLPVAPDVPMVSYDVPVVMVGGGAIDDVQLKALGAAHPIVAVDGGVEVVAGLGLNADIMIGDFDSAPPSARDANIRRVRITEQYSTDFQKALKVVQAPQILGFGFLGKRMDHSLATLHAIAEQPEHKILLIDPHDVVVMAGGKFSRQLPQDTRISIWPMHPQRFAYSKGLVWPMDGLELGVGQALGISNQVVLSGDETGCIAVEIMAEDASPYAVLMPPESLALLLSQALDD